MLGKTFRGDPNLAGEQDRRKKDDTNKHCLSIVGMSDIRFMGAKDKTLNSLNGADNMRVILEKDMHCLAPNPPPPPPGHA